MDLSNKTLGLLLVAAIVISIGGTIISLNKLDAVSTTGYAVQSGTVTLNVPEALSIVLTNASIDFGDCMINTTRGFNFVDSSLDVTGANNAECDGTLDFPDSIVVRNDGNVNANVSVRSDINGTEFFNEQNSWIAYRAGEPALNFGCANDLADTFTNFTVVGPDENYPFCGNLTTSVHGGTDAELFIQAYINAAATAGGVMTLTFEAEVN